MPRPARKTPPAPANTAPRLWNIRNAATPGSVPTIELFGDIGASKEPDWFWGGEPGAGTFQEFAAELKALGPVPEMNVEIHSYGGSVVVGKAMHDKLAEHPANKTAIIYGICASAATYPALACQTVRIPANSFFLIHNSSGCCCGEADDMRSMADMLDIADESIANLYAARTGKSVDEIYAIMDADTWMTGSAAVAMGLADEVIEPITISSEQRAIVDNFRPAALNSMPREARAWFDTSRLSSPQTALNTAMLKPHHAPLFNKATEAPAAGGGAAAPVVTPPAAPAAAPVVTPPAASNAAPVVTPPAAGTPITLEAIRDMMKAEFEPLNKRLETLEGLKNANVPANAWGNQPPVGHPKTGEVEEAFPQNKEELEAALQKCKNLNERIKLNNEFKKRQSTTAA